MQLSQSMLPTGRFAQQGQVVRLRPRGSFILTRLVISGAVSLILTIGSPASCDYSQATASAHRDDANMPQYAHRYVVESAWNGCGPIQYPGWEGCHSQSGSVFRCTDGARVYLVVEHCTSSFAANALRSSRLDGTGSTDRDWRIAAATPLGNALLVELGKPVSIGLDDSASVTWICLWTQDGTLRLVYGSDKEHVVDYFGTLKT